MKADLVFKKRLKPRISHLKVNRFSSHQIRIDEFREPHENFYFNFYSVVFLLTDDISYKRARWEKQSEGNLYIENIRCLLKISSGIVLRSNRKQSACQGTGMRHGITRAVGGNTNQE